MEYIPAWKLQDKKNLEEIYDLYYNPRPECLENTSLSKEEWCEYYKNLSIFKLVLENNKNNDLDYLISCVRMNLSLHIRQGNQLEQLSILILSKEDSLDADISIGKYFHHEHFSEISFWLNIAVCPDLEEPFQIKVVAGFYEPKAEKIYKELLMYSKKPKDINWEMLDLPIQTNDWLRKKGYKTIGDLFAIENRAGLLNEIPQMIIEPDGDKKDVVQFQRALNSVSMDFNMYESDLDKWEKYWEKRITGYTPVWKTQEGKDLEDLYKFFYNPCIAEPLHHPFEKDQWCKYFENLSIYTSIINYIDGLDDGVNATLERAIDRLEYHRATGNRLESISILALVKNASELDMVILHGVNTIFNIIECPDMDEPIQIRIVAGFYETKMEKIVREFKAEKKSIGEIINLKIEDLGFSVRATAACRNAGFKTLCDLLSVSRTTFYERQPYRSSERSSILVEQELNALSMTFRMKIKEIDNCLSWWNERIQ